MRVIAVLLVSTLVCGWSAGQDQDKTWVDALQKLDGRVLTPDSADAKLRWESLRALRDKVNQRDVADWRKITSRADWEKFLQPRIDALRKSLGEFPAAPEKVKVVTTRKIPGDGFSIENIIYESRPGLYFTANLYVPRATDKPMPGFVVIHSHHNPKTQGELQDMGMNWARQGCLVLVPDQLGHGERRQHPFNNAKAYPGEFKVGRQDYYFRYNTALQLHLVGESLIGWMVWDMMRGIDVLCQRPGIDKSKIIVLGSVAGGGDPCAVLAALDRRVTAAAPFNFGGPQPETKFPLPEDAELAFNYMGGGSWESTRNLRLSARDGFLPWVIVGSQAPRDLIYAHEFAWDQKNDPVWRRFEKLWGLYDVRDKLSSAHGRGSVRGQPPESTHCNNIGPEHRKPMYPALERWFGLPIPEKEFRGRVDSTELQCWTAEARAELKPQLAHELARDLARKRPAAPDSKDRLRVAWLQLLGVSNQGKWADFLHQPERAVCKVDSIGEETVVDVGTEHGFRMRRQIFRHESDPVLAVPVVTFLPKDVKAPPVVIALAQDGKAGFLKHRAETIAELLRGGVAVCLPDLRGTGETRSAGEGRGRASGATSISATEWMHGRTVPGTQLQELVMLMHELPKQGLGPIALWGDSFAEPNDPKMNFAVPHDADKMPRQSEPMGGVLALLGGIFGGDNVKGIYVRGGLVSFQSMLDSPFCYFPHDAVIPGVIRVGDMDALVEANPQRGIWLEGLVDGLNRRVDQAALAKTYGKVRLTRPSAHKMMVLREEASSPSQVATWIRAQVKK